MTCLALYYIISHHIILYYLFYYIIFMSIKYNFRTNILVATSNTSAISTIDTRAVIKSLATKERQ
jgi:hypothetical protein